MRIQRITDDCSCNNCLDRGLKEAYKIYVGRTSTTTVITLCVGCLVRLDADIHREVRKLAMSDIVVSLQKGREE